MPLSVSDSDCGQGSRDGRNSGEGKRCKGGRMQGRAARGMLRSGAHCGPRNSWLELGQGTVGHFSDTVNYTTSTIM